MDGDQEHQSSSAGAAMMPEQAGAVAVKRKVRMHPDDVCFVMSLKREELGGTEYLDKYCAHRYTPEEIEEMRRLHEELAALYLKDNDEIEARQAQIARELSEKGYVEVDAPPPPAADDEVDLEEERKRWGDNLEDYEDWASDAEYDRWADAFWEKMRNKRAAARTKFAVPDPGDYRAAVSWVVRPHDADDEEEQYGDEDSHAYQELRSPG